MPIPTGAVRAVNGGGIRNEDQGFVKPLGRRNEDASHRVKMDKLKNAYGSKANKLPQPYRPSTAGGSSRPSTAGGNSAVREARAMAAANRGGAPAAPKSKARAPDVMANFNVTVMRPSPAAAAAAAAGKTETGPGEDPLAQTMQSNTDAHDTMMNIFRSRTMALRAVSALKADGHDAVLSHVASRADVTLAVDVLPVITAAVKGGDKENTVTLPVCVELLPVLRLLINSAFEDYQIVVLEFLGVVVDAHRRELRSATKGSGMDVSISSQSFAMALISMTDRIGKIASDRTTKVSPTARLLAEKIDLL